MILFSKYFSQNSSLGLAIMETIRIIFLGSEVPSQREVLKRFWAVTTSLKYVLNILKAEHSHFSER